MDTVNRVCGIVGPCLAGKPDSAPGRIRTYNLRIRSPYLPCLVVVFGLIGLATCARQPSSQSRRGSGVVAGSSGRFFLTGQVLAQNYLAYPSWYFAPTLLPLVEGPAVKTQTLADLATEVRPLYAPPSRSVTTWYPIRQALRELGQLGAQTTADLSPALVARWLSAHPRRSAATSRKLLRALTAACKHAVYSGALERNPVEYRKDWVRAVKPRSKKHHAVSEVSAVLSLLESEAKVGWENARLFALVSLVAYTGVRKCEALHAKVEDFDLARGAFSIVARRRLKTAASEAEIPLPDRLVSVLESWLPRAGCEWAFPHKFRTGPWTGGRPGQKPLDQFRAAGLRAGVRDFTLLSLRHTWATLADQLWDLGDGVIKQVLRHTNLETQRHYKHRDLDLLRGRVAGLDFAGRAEAQNRGEKTTAISA